MEKEKLREQKEHGNRSFPYAFYHWEGECSVYSLLHWHEEMEIVYFEMGKFTFNYDMKEYEIQAPAFLFIQKEKLHRIDLREKQKESALVFHLDMLSFESYDETQMELLEPLLKGEMEFPLLIKEEQVGFEEIKKLYMQCMEQEEKKTIGSQLKIKSYLLQLLAEIYEERLFVKKEIEVDQNEATLVIKKVLAYIEEHYQEKMKIQELAYIANMNPQYFCRFFKRKVGKTFTAYVNEYRMERIKKELVRTRKKVIDIASENGFENIGYFMKQFKNNTGVTPLTYRKQKADKG